MKKAFLIVILTTLIGISEVFSQSLSPIELNKQGSQTLFQINKIPYKAIFGEDEQSSRPYIEFNGKKTFKYNSIFQDAILDFQIFYNPKLNFQYLIINNYVDLSLGADLFLIKDGEFSYIGNLNLGAYNSINGNKMNYNSILPYISVFYTKEKTYFSFEVPLVVLNPAQKDEQIFKGNELHYILTDNKLSLVFSK
ncbi:MAG: hypothetical protein LBM25_03815 [Bacteroidales bacterium]|jgi:hypothetical protein|nr:hypothetical protein [Bacteroidales bacterium]